jgi:hypothetical protein
MFFFNCNALLTNNISQIKIQELPSTIPANATMTEVPTTSLYEAQLNGEYLT